MYAQITWCMHRSCDVCIDQIMQGKYLWTMMSSMVIWSQCDVHVTSSMTEVYKGFPNRSQCSTPDDQLQWLHRTIISWLHDFQIQVIVRYARVLLEMCLAQGTKFVIYKESGDSLPTFQRFACGKPFGQEKFNLIWVNFNRGSSSLSPLWTIFIFSYFRTVATYIGEL